VHVATTGLLTVNVYAYVGVRVYERGMGTVYRYERIGLNRLHANYIHLYYNIRIHGFTPDSVSDDNKPS
jgi:hypothetical protein